MNSNHKFYLAKNGNVSGPMENHEIESLRANGQLELYTWLWKQGDANWTPIDPAPPLPQITGAVANPVAAAVAAPTPPPFRSRVTVRPLAQETYRAVLFDHHNAISGWLLSAHEGGCEIRSDQEGCDPLFVQKSTACLSLHNPKNGEALKVNVRLSAVQRQDGSWTYRLRWKPLPALEELLQVS